MRTDINPSQKPLPVMYEELSNGQKLPVFEPSYSSDKIKTRKYTAALAKYHSSRGFETLLNQGHRVIGFEDLKNLESDEEKLAADSHELIVFEAPNKTLVQRVVSKHCTLQYKQFSSSNESPKQSVIHKTVADAKGVVSITFTNRRIETSMEIDFDFVYIERNSLMVIERKESIKLDSNDDLKFDVLLWAGELCIVWKSHNICTRWYFDSTENTVDYLQFKIEENLEDAYSISMDEKYVTVSVKDEEFYDDVFGNTNASKRLSVYYDYRTGARFDTKEEITKALQIDTMHYPSDALFLEIPDNPKWMVLEWVLKDMTLGFIYFYKLKQGCMKRDGVLNFQDLFPKYKTYFDKPNNLQYKVTISNTTWQAFIWTSKNHVLVIDLKRYEVVAILKLDLIKYKDFRNEFHSFDITVSDSSKDVTVYIKRFSEVVHFARFTLQALNKEKNTKQIFKNPKDLLFSPQKKLKSLNITCTSKKIAPVGS